MLSKLFKPYKVYLYYSTGTAEYVGRHHTFEEAKLHVRGVVLGSVTGLGTIEDCVIKGPDTLFSKRDEF